MVYGALAFAALSGSASLTAQDTRTIATPLHVGSDHEQFLRTSQLIGRTTMQPWSLRDFGPGQWRELQAADSSARWQGADARFAWQHGFAGIVAFAQAPGVRVSWNSTFPIASNDGAVWEGRGLSVATDMTAGILFGPVTAILAPLAFSTENRSFVLASNGQPGRMRFADWRNPATIDLPQRFGDDRYARIDLGQSSVSADLFGLTLGASTANQFFGPAYDHPLILGRNAGGFPHLRFGSAKPIQLWRVGRVHVRAFWGTLDETSFSQLADSGYTRMASGLVGVLQPALMPGLEVGGVRFVHQLQRGFRVTAADALRPFRALLFNNAGADADNQLVSVFGRLVLPEGGVEVYGEFGREDTNADLREFLYFPDHDSAYLLGLRKAWRRSLDVWSVRGEVLNSRVTHLALSSRQTIWYVHDKVRQGHTHRGQTLGSPAVYGGGASVLALERLHRRGRWRVEWHRALLAEALAPGPDPFGADVAHSLSTSALRLGARADVEVGVAALYEVNRHFGRDARALRLTIVARGPSRR